MHDSKEGDVSVKMDDRIVCEERYGSQRSKKIYIRKSDNTITIVDQSASYTSVTNFLMDAFLPMGYPESVSNDYMDYQIWDTVQAFSSYTISTLATQAVMVGYGVGDKEATAAAATITWILKSLTGYGGRIFFTWYQGLSFDSDCKRWRLAADVLNDIAICLEIFAPIFRQYFTLFVCLAELTRNICGAAGSATRAAMTVHQARRDNMADVSAKDGSQETCVHSFSLLFGLVLIPMVAGNQGAVWTLFIIFTSLHLLANYKAVRSVVMESINQSRLNILVHHYMGYNGFIMSLRDVNVREPVIFKLKRRMNVILGAELHQIISRMDDLVYLQNVFKSKNYLINIDLHKETLNVVLSQRSTIDDQLQSCFHAEVINFALENGHRKQSRDMVFFKDADLTSLFAAACTGDVRTLLELSTNFTDRNFPHFHAAVCNEGWNPRVNLLGATEWRASWDDYKRTLTQMSVE